MHEEMNTTEHSSWDIVNGYEFVMSILEIKNIFNGKTEILHKMSKIKNIIYSPDFNVNTQYIILTWSFF